MKIIFVHGTGVRQPAFAATFKTVQMNVAQFLPTASVVPCYWGDFGSNIGKGLSVPLYDQSKSIGQDTPESEGLARWALLYDDPLIELRLLASKASGPTTFAGFGETPAATMRKALTRLRTEIDLGKWPAASGELSSSAVNAVEAVRTFQELETAAAEGVKLAKSGDQGLDSVRLLVARAVTAGWTLEQMKSGAPSVSAPVRDAMQQSAFEILGGGSIQTKGLVAGIVGVLTKPLLTLLSATVGDPAMQTLAWGGRAYRHTIANAATPGVGDILLYQARGEKIRSVIASAIEEAGDSPVLLLAHSLGGIACIDLLIASAQVKVKGVVTVGSQAPFLYEIGALTQLEAPAELPTHMPRWLNIFDRDDLLSFKAEPIMKGGVSDSEIRSHQPFPAAHSAYWSNPQVWERIEKFVQSLKS